MPELNSGVAAKGGKKGHKNEEQKVKQEEQVAARGTAAPLPTEADVPTAEAKAADEKAQKLAAAKNAAAEAIKAKLEALKKELAATREAEKAERDKEKNAKKAEREASLAVRAEKEKQLAEADAKIAKAQKDLETTEEWRVLKAMEAERAAIGPLPKVSKGGGGGSGKPRKPREKDGPTLRQRLFELLNQRGMTGAEVRDALELTTVPMILKDEGVCENPRITRFMEEGQRGVKYELTARGKEDLAAGKVDENAAPGSSGISWPE